MAISIPIFTTQLEKSREAVDQANIRAAYAEVSAAALTDELTSCYKEVVVKQSQVGWQGNHDLPAELSSWSYASTNTAKKTYVTYTYTAGTSGAAGTQVISITDTEPTGIKKLN